MVESRRESDTVMLQVSRELGQLGEAVRAGTIDRERIWKEVSQNAKETRDEIQELSSSIRTVVEVLKAIPEINSTISQHDDRIDSLEDTNKRHKWTVAGIAAGMGLGGGAGLPALITWVQHLLSTKT